MVLWLKQLTDQTTLTRINGLEYTVNELKSLITNLTGVIEKNDQATKRPTNLKFNSTNMIEKNALPPVSLPPKDTKTSLLMEDDFTSIRKTSLERTQSEDKPQFQETLQSDNKGNIDIHHSNIFTPITAIKKDQPTIQDSAEEIKGIELGEKYSNSP